MTTCGNVQLNRIVQSRVSMQNDRERNFHVFYYLLEGASDDDKRAWSLRPASDFIYLNRTGCYAIADENPADEYRQLKDAMRTSGFTDDEVHNILSVIVTVLHLGNLSIAQASNDGSSIESSDRELDVITKILQCSKGDVSLALTQRFSIVRTEHVTMVNDVQQAESTRDTLAQQLYERTFDFIVRRLNEELSATGRSPSARVPAHSLSILLLDMFGFESFKVNSFEQLCINYANERLQMLFNDYVFGFEMKAYEDEGLALGNISYNSNQPCIDLFEQKPLGIIRILEEECKFPKATDASFLSKVEAQFAGAANDRSPFVKQRFGGPIFSIRHYSGVVPYTVTGFLAKNRQQFSTSLARLVTEHSKSIFIRHLFDDLVEVPDPTPASSGRESTTSTTTKRTLISQFHASLTSLVSRLSSCEPHFIRCIKSNSRNAPMAFDSGMIASQLRDIGVLEAIRIRSEGFPQRHTFTDLLHRFACLLPTRNQPVNVDARQQIVALLDHLGIEFPSVHVQLGRTKVFFKSHVYERLEFLVGCAFAESATRIQATFRRFRAQRLYGRKRQSALFLQARLRRCVVRSAHATAWPG
ncbi:Myosin motor domain-containing protein [Plasmodiophora brassicae]|uniref:Myosin motor domain-containing protein n=1 Tax=Plasmodiophora brassicae TaxID=37360 RepID=A0A0G4J1C2_PLABS|nr:hypothetical protein PBRA_001918 [Plasmodiophora brassicae]